LNTAQQMGGAVGLAALSTVSFGVFRDKIKPELLASQGHPSQAAIAVASTHGYTIAFWVAAVMILAAGATLTVVAVEATSTGTLWVLERASDGARASVRLVGQGIAGASIAAGTIVVATALSTGWILSAAGQAIAFIPNEIGRALLYNERITR